MKYNLLSQVSTHLKNAFYKFFYFCGGVQYMTKYKFIKSINLVPGFRVHDESEKILYNDYKDIYGFRKIKIFNDNDTAINVVLEFDIASVMLHRIDDDFQDIEVPAYIYFRLFFDEVNIYIMGK